MGQPAQGGPGGCVALPGDGQAGPGQPAPRRPGAKTPGGGVSGAAPAGHDPAQPGRLHVQEAAEQIVGGTVHVPGQHQARYVAPAQAHAACVRAARGRQAGAGEGGVHAQPSCAASPDAHIAVGLTPMLHCVPAGALTELACRWCWPFAVRE